MGIMEDGMKPLTLSTKPCHLRDISVNGKGPVLVIATITKAIKSFYELYFLRFIVYKCKLLCFQSAPWCPGQGTAEDGASAGQPTDYPTDSLYGGELIESYPLLSLTETFILLWRKHRQY